MDKAGNDVSHGKRERTPSGPETVIGIDVRGWSPGRIVVRFRRRYRQHLPSTQVFDFTQSTPCWPSSSRRRDWTSRRVLGIGLGCRVGATALEYRAPAGGLRWCSASCRLAEGPWPTTTSRQGIPVARAPSARRSAGPRPRMRHAWLRRAGRGRALPRHRRPLRRAGWQGKKSP